jgi:hypothetical protein
LRLAAATGPWWRIDEAKPAAWTWDPFPTPRHRFDPPSARFRVRYAASTPTAAARERFPARTPTEADGNLRLVRLDGSPSALHLTRQSTLDALGLDDRASTGRLDEADVHGDPLLATAQQLSDSVYDWWDGVPPLLVYRTRSTPSARSIAFTRTVAWSSTSSGPFRHAVGLLVLLVTRHGFTVPDHWLR